MSDYAIVNLLQIDDSVGSDGLVLIAVAGPKPEGGDGVRAETSWPDEPES